MYVVSRRTVFLVLLLDWLVLHFLLRVYEPQRTEVSTYMLRSTLSRPQTKDNPTENVMDSNKKKPKLLKLTRRFGFEQERERERYIARTK